MPPSNKKQPDRQIVRMAQSLRDQLSHVARQRATALAQQLSRLTGAIGQLDSMRRKLNLALARGWDVATIKLCHEVPDTLRDIPYYMDSVKREAEACEIGVPTLRTMLDDLHQLQAEFGDIGYRPNGEGLSAITDDIELEDVYLGPFEIRLDPAGLGRDQGYAAFKIIAQDPHPAGSNSSITHPHVSDERLCAGDAAAPIRSALASGRICDAFLLVRSVLTTYNSSSPYVALADWDGQSCSECGYSCGSDGPNTCQACDRELCDGCASFCRICSDTHCVGCLNTCPVCDERVCESCMTKCPDCGEELCTSCREDGKCPCHEDDDQNDNEESDDNDSEQQDQQPQREEPAVTSVGSPASPNIEAA